MARTHVAIIDPKFADRILAGEKTAEVRLTRTRRAPFGVVSLGDEILFRARSGWYVARALVDRADCIEIGSREDFRRVRALCSDGACAPASFWKERAEARYATIVWLAGVEPTAAGPDPRSVAAPGCRSAWFVVDPSNTEWVCEPQLARA
ncbi:MAG: ASCH domain-containing protein [Phycisphaerales bacterium]